MGIDQPGKIFVGRSVPAGKGDQAQPIEMTLKLANRHGLVTGATGTGKTVSLQVLAEGFSRAGVPVFAADIKGDLSGMCEKGKDSEDMRARIARFGLDGFVYKSYPTRFWDIFGDEGHPVRVTVPMI